MAVVIDTTLSFNSLSSGSNSAAIKTNFSNELAVLFLGNTDTGISSVTDSASSAWTQAVSNHDAALGDLSAIWWAIVASPQASYTVNITSATGAVTGGLLVTFSGAAQTSPIGATNNANNASGATAVSLSVTATANHSAFWSVIQSEAGTTPTMTAGQTIMGTETVTGAAKVFPVRYNGSATTGDVVNLSTSNGFSWTVCMIEILAAGYNRGFITNNVRPHPFSPGLAR